MRLRRLLVAALVVAACLLAWEPATWAAGTSYQADCSGNSWFGSAPHVIVWSSTTARSTSIPLVVPSPPAGVDLSGATALLAPLSGFNPASVCSSLSANNVAYSMGSSGFASWAQHNGGVQVGTAYVMFVDYPSSVGALTSTAVQSWQQSWFQAVDQAWNPPPSPTATPTPSPTTSSPAPTSSAASPTATASPSPASSTPTSTPTTTGSPTPAPTASPASSTVTLDPGQWDALLFALALVVFLTSASMVAAWRSHRD